MNIMALVLAWNTRKTAIRTRRSCAKHPCHSRWRRVRRDHPSHLSPRTSLLRRRGRQSPQHPREQRQAQSHGPSAQADSAPERRNISQQFPASLSGLPARTGRPVRHTRTHSRSRRPSIDILPHRTMRTGDKSRKARKSIWTHNLQTSRRPRRGGPLSRSRAAGMPAAPQPAGSKDPFNGPHLVGGPGAAKRPRPRRDEAADSRTPLCSDGRAYGI